MAGFATRARGTTPGRRHDAGSPSFLGRTGAAGVQGAKGMPPRKEAVPRSWGSGAYAVTNFAAVIVDGRDDRVAMLYPSGVSPADIAAAYRCSSRGDRTQ